MKYPSISIIIVTKNSAQKLGECLKRINDQEYPKDKIEILVIDGGSSDDTCDITRAYHAHLIAGGYSNNMEARRFVGIKQAKNEIIVSIDTDNYLPDTKWLKTMIQPLEDDPEIFAVQTLRYEHRKSDTLFNRYCALFGVNDPIALYLKKNDRLPYYESSWKMGGEAIDTGNYYKVKFSTKNLPTVGANGFLIRRDIILRVLTVPENFFHIDVIYDLVKIGFTHMAFVKNSIIHETSDTLWKLIQKRINYFNNHSISLFDKRRYKVYNNYNKKDKLMLLRFILLALTLVEPLFQSIRGFVKKRDIAWFLHPIVCVMFLYAYGYAIIQKIKH